MLSRFVEAILSPFMYLIMLPIRVVFFIIEKVLDRIDL